MPASPLPFAQLAPLVAGLSIRGDADYEAARAGAIWNKRLDAARSPDAVVRCTRAAHMQAAIRFATAHDLRVSLRGSGHSYIAAPLRDGGLLLDCGDMDAIAIDPLAKAARIGPGTRGGALIHALSAHDLAFPIGHCSTVAMGGYLLSGGVGWNSGAWGAASDHLRAVEVVAADGRMLRASEMENTDLFWAAKGAGCGFFAAVTAYEIALQPLPRAALEWTASFPAHAAPALRDWLNAATRAAHPAAEIMCLIGPDLHSGRPSLTIRAVGIANTAEQAAARIASFRSVPPDVERLSDMVEKPLAFTELTSLSAMPDGKRVAADQLWSEYPLGDLAVAVHHLADRPRPSSTINLVSPGGAGRIPGFGMGNVGALSAGGGVSAGIYAIWDDPADDGLHRAWVRDADAALAPFRNGRYIGEADLCAGPGRVAECFSAPALARLEDLRNRHDPDRRFFGFPDAG